MTRNIVIGTITAFFSSVVYAGYAFVYLANNKDPLEVFISAATSYHLAIIYAILALSIMIFRSRIAAVMAMVLYILNSLAFVDMLNPMDGIVGTVILFVGFLLGILGTFDYQSENAENNMTAMAANSVLLICFGLMSVYSTGIFTDKGMAGKNWFARIKNNVEVIVGAGTPDAPMPFKDQRYYSDNSNSFSDKKPVEQQVEATPKRMDYSNGVWQWKDKEGNYHITTEEPPSYALDVKRVK